MAKKITVTVIFVLVLILTGTVLAEASTSEDYSYGSIGYQQPMFNFSGAQRFGDFGIEIGLGLRIYPGIMDYPCPHDDYTIIDDNYYSVLLGVDMLRYVDIGENCSVYAGAGFYILGYDTVAESNATGWVYRQYSSIEGKLAFSGGLQFYPDEGLGMGIGYHTLRGANLQLILRM